MKRLTGQEAARVSGGVATLDEVNAFVAELLGADGPSALADVLDSMPNNWMASISYIEFGVHENDFLVEVVEL